MPFYVNINALIMIFIPHSFDSNNWVNCIIALYLIIHREHTLKLALLIVQLAKLMLTAMFSNAEQYNLAQRSLARLLMLIMLTLAKALYPTYFTAGDSLTHWPPQNA